MDKNRLLRAVCSVLIAALMAGCSAYLLVRAAGLSIPWAQTYLLAFGAALLVQLGRRSTVWAIGTAAVMLAALGALLAVYLSDVVQALYLLAEQGNGADMSACAAAGQGMGLILALSLGMLLALMIKSYACAPFALIVLLASVICALAVNEAISLWAALPGLIAGVAVFAVPSDARREGIRPALLLPAALLTTLALALVPAERVTWAPLEELAQRIRSVAEDYIRFTEERVAFSINEKGYDHAGMIEENVVAMLGGPAEPDEEAVMRVQTDANLLLRGSIKRSYTGYSWVDDQSKARYLYYDFTHRGTRETVFNARSTLESERFVTVSASVELLSEGTSTLFVPALLTEFDMSLANAVYYNSTGEIFLTRDVQAGDGYAFSARVPRDGNALIAAAAQYASSPDKGYEAALSAYTALPNGIDSQVYAMAVELTAHTNNAAEKAFSIQEHLAQNYHYTLDGGYPNADQDFVSWFLLESKEGYCSYFASAMTVLCRIAGLPARYVEGYYVPAQPNGESLVTGKNAHAWVEVYLNGLGWVAFDPTARAMEVHQGEGALDQSLTPPDHGSIDEDGSGQDEASGDHSDGDPSENDEQEAPDPTPTPTPNVGSDPDPTPSPAPNDGAKNQEETPTPAPDSGESPFENEPPDDEPPTSNSSKSRARRWWLWLLLLALAAAAAVGVLWLRKRLAATDPLKLCVSVKDPQQAAMILYRGILTLLMQAGLTPRAGETPEAFAQRAVLSIPNPDYEYFVSETVRSRYSGRNLSREALDAGRGAYVVFLNGMRKSERIRFHIRRTLYSLGSFENIP